MPVAVHVGINKNVLVVVTVGVFVNMGRLVWVQAAVKVDIFVDVRVGAMPSPS
jgi:hypothetical protein